VKKAVMKEKSGKILGLLSGGKRRAFFGRRCCKNVRVQSGRKKEVWKDFQKMDAKYFCLRKLFWDTPVYHVEEWTRVVIRGRA
jgi:formylmethanofuran dehydrogenase subunit A